MPLEQTFTLNRSADKQNLLVTDTTGAYDATTNPTGYGGVNPSASDFTALSISMYLPDPVTLQPSTTAIPITAIFPTLPSETNGTYTITSTALLGSETVLVDGLYKGIITATYDIGAGDVSISPITIYKPFYYIAECCWQQNMLEVNTCGDKEKRDRLSFGGAILQMLSPYINSLGVVVLSPIEQCENWNKSVEFMLYLKELCEEFNCGGGCQSCH
jgi:hypothetical protein